MSKVIRFLESVGAAPALLPDQYAELVAGLNVEDAERDALMQCDAALLGNLLDGRSVMRCSIFEPQRHPEPEQDPSEGGEEPDSVPDDESQSA